jgi:hypothetical protein
MQDFFIHLPASTERGNGCKAWGIQSEFVLPFPIEQDSWEKAQAWLNKEKGKYIEVSM